MQASPHSPFSISMPTAVEKIGVKKANMPFRPSFMLAVVAGGSIGFGALYYTIVSNDEALSFATTQVIGGLVFSVGLAIVLVGGAELFTGNNLIVMAWASRRISVVRNWLIVYIGNLVGALGLVLLVLFSHHPDMKRRAHRTFDFEYGGWKDHPRHGDAVL